jgi:hypothetical protein
VVVVCGVGGDSVMVMLMNDETRKGQHGTNAPAIDNTQNKQQGRSVAVTQLQGREQLRGVSGRP